jgi:hypothetical protein
MLFQHSQKNIIKKPLLVKLFKNNGTLSKTFYNQNGMVPMINSCQIAH